MRLHDKPAHASNSVGAASTLFDHVAVVTSDFKQSVSPRSLSSRIDGWFSLLQLMANGQEDTRAASDGAGSGNDHYDNAPSAALIAMVLGKMSLLQRSRRFVTCQGGRRSFWPPASRQLHGIG